jgi:hypothetical protein
VVCLDPIFIIWRQSQEPSWDLASDLQPFTCSRHYTLTILLFQPFYTNHSALPAIRHWPFWTPAILPHSFCCSSHSTLIILDSCHSTPLILLFQPFYTNHSVSHSAVLAIQYISFCHPSHSIPILLLQPFYTNRSAAQTILHGPFWFSSHFILIILRLQLFNTYHPAARATLHSPSYCSNHSTLTNLLLQPFYTEHSAALEPFYCYNHSTLLIMLL